MALKFHALMNLPHLSRVNLLCVSYQYRLCEPSSSELLCDFLARKDVVIFLDVINAARGEQTPWRLTPAAKHSVSFHTPLVSHQELQLLRPFHVPSCNSIDAFLKFLGNDQHFVVMSTKFAFALGRCDVPTLLTCSIPNLPSNC